MLEYHHTLDGITADMLQGFFVGWRMPLSQDEHLQVLKNSYAVLLAVDTETNQVVGFVNALSDGFQAAFIPLLEVSPAYQNQGTGSELMRQMLVRLEGIYGVDLMCEPHLQRFYERFDLQRSVGMLRRNY